MLTLITGNPRAGKTLYTVAEICKPVPGSSIEDHRGRVVQRTLYSNIDGLVLPHERIDADGLRTWHTWAKKGDVIVFDEVQEVWRPRALGKEVPDAIAALETHGHLGVDIVLITQNPMLVDSNIRRLVNRHVHVRRLPAGWAYLYEWDHCGTPGQYKTCIEAKTWRYPREVFDWYKSADLHTKPTIRAPKLAYLGLAALALTVYAAPQLYSRVSERTAPKKAEAASSLTVPGLSAVKLPALPAAPAGVASGPSLQDVVAPAAMTAISAPAAFSGCAMVRDRCSCFTSDGQEAPPPGGAPGACESKFAGPPPLSLDGMAALEPVGAAVYRPEDGDVLSFMRARR